MGMGGLANALGNSALVVKEFNVQDNGPEYVHIVARKSGLISWFMSLIGIDSTTTFQLFENRVLFTEGSLSGQMQTCMPLAALSVATCGYFKPFPLLITGIVLLLAGLGSFAQSAVLAILLLLVGAGIIIAYFLKKTLLVQVVANSGWAATICFKRSVIEGVEVSYDKAMKVIEIINKLLVEKTAH